MSREKKIWDGSGAGKTINPGLSRDLCPSVGCPPSISRPLLNRLRRGLYFNQDPLLQIRDECRCPVDKALREFIFGFTIPIRAETIGGLAAQAEGIFSSRRMGWVDLRRSEEVEGGVLGNSIFIEEFKFLLELALKKDFIV